MTSLDLAFLILMIVGYGLCRCLLPCYVTDSLRLAGMQICVLLGFLAVSSLYFQATLPSSSEFGLLKLVANHNDAKFLTPPLREALITISNAAERLAVFADWCSWILFIVAVEIIIELLTLLKKRS